MKHIEKRTDPARLPWRALLLLLLPVLLGCEDLRAPAPPPAEKRQASEAGQTKPVKLWIDRTGVYRVPIRDLARFGWNPVLLSACSLTTAGVSTPYWIDGIGDDTGFCFFAQASESRYTPFAVYVLRPGSTASAGRPGEVKRVSSARVKRSRDAFRSTVRFELNRLYEPLAELPVPWLWERLVAPGKKSFEIKLEGVLKGPCTLRLRLWAKTQATTTTPDHHLRVAANGANVEDQMWDGAGLRQIVINIRDGVFREGVNRITLELPGDTEAPAEIIFVDSIEVSHLRRLDAGENDTLEFSDLSGAVTLEGFSGPVTVVDTGNRQLVARLSSAEPAFEAEAGRSYLAAGAKGFLKPSRVDVFGGSGPNLRDPALQADYLAIGSPELLAPLGPLLKSHETSGLTTLTVPTQAIYDQFHHGMPEPEGVRSFLRFASERWKRAPRYVLLVGDGSYDTHGFLEKPPPALLPGFFTRTVFGGETVTDLEFGRIKDGRPEIAVGRIPARTPEQVRILVDKVREFNTRKAGKSRVRILSVADGADPSFREEAKNFLAQFPDEFEKALYMVSGEEASGETGKRSRPMTDPLLFFYFGHGSVQQLGRDIPGGAQRHDARIWAFSAPIAFHVTCLSGFYAHPQVACLAEESLWRPESRVLAVLAPTGLTLPEHQRCLTRALTASLVNSRRLRLGDLVLEVWRKLDPDVPGQREVMETFLLFGCPALELPLP